MGDVAEALGLPLDPVARLDENGDLSLEPALVERAKDAFAARLGPGYLHAVGETMKSRCDELQTAVEEAAACGRSDGAKTKAMIADLGDRIARVLPYPIVAKFVPEVLLHALSEAGAPRPALLQARSRGARLSEALLRLAEECRSRGYSPERLEAEWPGVGDEVRSLVLGFAEEHAGSGPVAWEAEGYETPSYVVGAIRAAFSGLDSRTLHSRLADPEAAADTVGSPWANELRQAVASWAEFIDQEIWLVRRAFYRGLLPLLRALADEAGLHPEDVLFVAVDELAGSMPEAGEVARRRRRYFANRPYASRHGVSSRRLHAIMEGLW